MMAPVLLALGGAVGAMSRFVVDALIRHLWSARFPVATLIINTTGSLALGLITAGATLGVWTRCGLLRWAWDCAVDSPRSRPPWWKPCAYWVSVGAWPGSRTCWAAPLSVSSP